MGKLCVVLITFSSSSGPSISTRNRVHWVKLSLISFSLPHWREASKLKAFPAVSFPNERHDNEENTKLNLIVFSGADKPLA